MVAHTFEVDHQTTVTITRRTENQRKARMTFQCRKREGSPEMFIKLASNNQVSRLLGFPRNGQHIYPMAKTKFISQMKHARDRLYTEAVHKAILDQEEVVLGLGDDEIDTSTQPPVEIAERLVEIDVPPIAGIQSQTIKVVLAPPRASLEVMATQDQLLYLSKVLSAHVGKKLEMDDLCVEEGKDEIVDDEDGADEVNGEVQDAD